VRRYRYERPYLYPKQELFLFTPARYSICEASTKSGKTFGCMVWLYEKALEGKRGWHYWWVAPIRAQAKIAYDRYCDLLPPGTFQRHDSELYLTVATGARIWFKGADKPDSLYGDDVHAAVIDEASRCKEPAWIAVRSTLTFTQGPIRIIGNVRGRKNWAYRLAVLAKAEADSPTSPYRYSKLTAWDAVDGGVLERAEVEDAQRVLPEDAFKELYLAEAADDGSNPFGLEAIQKCADRQAAAQQLSRILGRGRPGAIGPAAVWGWDLAKKVDWTWGTPLDAAGLIVAPDGKPERWRKDWETTTEVILRLVGKLPAAVDSTGVGDPIVERLQKGGRWNFEGYAFSPSSKQKLMEGLAMAIHGTEVGVLAGQMQEELDNFEYEYTRTGVRYTAPEGYTDDGVMSLALAVYKRSAAGKRASRGGSTVAL
jgi:hypothetical protein